MNKGDRNGYAGDQIDIAEVQQKLIKARTELDALYRSGSWRITAPLRAISRIVLGFGLFRPLLGTGLINFLRTSPSLSGLRRFRRSLIQRSPFSKRAALPKDGLNYVSTVSAGEFKSMCRLLSDVKLEFPEYAAPLVSIIIPVFEKVELTIQCLASLVQLHSQYSFEVIVIDDNSSDDTQQEISVIPGIHYLRNEKNMGFTLSCNRSLGLARGQFLVFLNNDTVVRENWLDYLVITFQNDPRVGLVGSKLIYPDGRLQEAGGLLWDDATAWNVGREGDPVAPEYNYLREADYCSAASLMVRSELFRELGGFDEQFAPGYYEDTDLALSIRKRGLKIMYQPFSEVFHVEGGTAGTDVSDGMKAYQVINEQTFFKKWAKELSSYGASNSDRRLSQDKWCIGRVLVVDVWPRPDMDSGSIDAVNLFRNLLTMGYKVTFVPDNSVDHYGRYTRELQELGVECLYSPYFQDLATYLKSQGPHFDIVILRRVAAASKHMANVRRYCPDAKVIFDTVDVHHIREKREAEIVGSESLMKQAKETEQRELELISHSDVTIVLSETEKNLLDQQVSANIRWIPFSRDVHDRKHGFDDRKDIVFIGNYMHNPNVDAVRYFVSDIWPLIAERLPEARFKFYGSELPDSLEDMQDDRIVSGGYVKELRDVFEQARVSVAPLRFGAGTKGKVVTSLSYGVPVVATSIAAEGMPGKDECMLIADSPAEFADRVVKIYREQPLWENMSDIGITIVRDFYSETSGMKYLQDLFSDMGLANTRPENSQPTTLSVLNVESAGEQNHENKQDVQVRALAFYLPQYHTIPENNSWWGNGFTEWTNVTKARPLFEGHYQPHLPGDLGFYDLRVPDTREAQAEMASHYGLEGFCYYHYWFGGKRLLERPFNEVLLSGKPDFPFCLCWANENWTRRWDGRESEVLMDQVYSDENDRAFIRELFPAFEDDRYIRVNGKPILLVYRTESLPNPGRSAEIWREECHRAGIGDIYLCRGETFDKQDPNKIGFDAAYEFPPLMMATHNVSPEPVFNGPEKVKQAGFTGKIYQYEDLIESALKRTKPCYRHFRGVAVSWDNTARIGSRAYMWLGSTPENYGQWLKHIVRETVREQAPSERLVFINAWNEWGEGCHLEPDQRYGRRYLEATRDAILQVKSVCTPDINQPL